MSRSGYSDDCDQWDLIRWRGAVASAIKGRRGQEFLYELLHAMAALPEPKLIAHDLEKDGCVCALGAVGKARGLDMTNLDPDDPDSIAGAFGISSALAKEIVYMNDEWNWREDPEVRFSRMRQWVEGNILKEKSAYGPTPEVKK